MCLYCWTSSLLLLLIYSITGCFCHWWTLKSQEEHTQGCSPCLYAGPFCISTKYYILFYFPKSWNRSLCCVFIVISSDIFAFKQNIWFTVLSSFNELKYVFLDNVSITCSYIINDCSITCQDVLRELKTCLITDEAFQFAVSVSL